MMVIVSQICASYLNLRSQILVLETSKTFFWICLRSDFLYRKYTPWSVFWQIFMVVIKNLLSLLFHQKYASLRNFDLTRRFFRSFRTKKKVGGKPMKRILLFARYNKPWSHVGGAGIVSSSRESLSFFGEVNFRYGTSPKNDLMWKKNDPYTNMVSYDSTRCGDQNMSICRQTQKTYSRDDWAK